MINDISELYGRQIKMSAVSKVLLSQVEKRPAIIRRQQKMWCARCGTRLNRHEVGLPQNHFYCPVCIQMGRMDTRSELVTVLEPNQFKPIAEPMSWQGKLTPLQQRCADEIIAVFKQKKRHLLWAVTGAGKTEMLFPAIEWAVKQGLRIGIASPRVDVCIELFPRIQAAFQPVSSILLHGKSEQPYKYTQIVVCTTHQLLRFYRAFDVMVIDEVDVFPFSGNAMLHFAVQNAIKQSGGLLYLTATPDQSLMRQIHRHSLSVGYLPMRFHGHLLPEAQIVKVRKLREQLQHNRLPRKIMAMIRFLVDQKQRFLLFVPRITDLSRIKQAIDHDAIECRYDTVYSADPQRLEKVAAMRQEKLDFLVTTTILERGVTFPGIDVLVVAADDAVFSSSALVQIAGRVGRNQDRPDGRVILYCEQKTPPVKSCVHQIKAMNYRARQL